MKENRYSDNEFHRVSVYNTHKRRKKKRHFKNVLFLLLFITILFVAITYTWPREAGRVSEGNKLIPIIDFIVNATEAKAEEQPPVVENREIKASHYYYDSLSEEDRKIYESIVAGIKSLDRSISVGISNESKVDLIISAILAEHPEIFWIDGSYKKILSPTDEVVSFNYLLDAKEIQSREYEIERCVRTFLVSISENMSDYEKIKKAFEFIVDTVEYEKCEDDQNLYSALINHKSVCAGYSRAMQYLLQRMGIESIMVTGQAYGQDAWDAHGWLIVKCDNDYYHVDCTFADGISSACEEIGLNGMYGYEYLCRNDASMRSNHSWSVDEPKIPLCNDDNLNYYKINGMYSVKEEGAYENMRASIYSGKRTWTWQFEDSYYYNKCVESKQYLKYVSEYMQQSVSGKIMPNDAMKVVIMCYD